MNLDNQEAEVQLEAKIEEKRNVRNSARRWEQDYNFKKKAWSSCDDSFGKHLLLWSFIASFFFSVANSLFTSLAHWNLQTQNLYAGWAMTQGQVAYGQFLWHEWHACIMW